ncbi:sensor histidine kinase [Chryseobacterium caseinilyticum]|uniref:Histidine kinase domain-containing protein n=1 Tax=Chryseobacterium caseinilyticum TaxID=2771428 RepID=A0ABR8ZF33_9FLAO|nr:ATP-binding protein [Chryseobacterium caseinilyticum]MBD8083896.1 hypothetical protein [Chryseobacterium caseinilyticum]
MMNLLKTLGVVTLLFLSGSFFAQNHHFIRNFNTENSNLADNIIYDIEEDTKGFLWLATENGLSRFDGKNFFNYTVKNGLPSNEVLSVIKEKNGRIWANCFKQPPSYFDEKNNRFVTEKSPEIEAKSNTVMLHYFPLRGGIVFYGQHFHFFYLNGKLQSIHKDFFPISVENRDNSAVNVESLNKLFHADRNILFRFAKQKIYVFDNLEGKTITEISALKNDPLTSPKKKIIFPAKIQWKRFYENHLLINTIDNQLTVIDLKTFSIVKKIKFKEAFSNAFIDHSGNIWISVPNGGLQLYTSSAIRKIHLDNIKMNENFLSVASGSNGNLFAGNYSGQIISVSKSGQKELFELENVKERIRKILFFKNAPLLISDYGYAYKSKKLEKILVGDVSQSLKNGMKLNDSIAVLGSINSLIRLNVLTKKYRFLNFPEERIGSIDKISENELLITSSKRLSVYNVEKNTRKDLWQKLNLAEGIVNGNLFFVSNLSGEISVFKNRKLIKTIKNSENLPTTISKIFTRKNKLWMAGKDGLYQMIFKEKNGVFNYRIFRITKSDGLASNSIFDITENDNSICVATENGISIIPENYIPEIFDIKSEVISVKINNKNTTILDEYLLKKNENNISILLSGIELSGHTKAIQYLENNQKKWIPVSGNSINLQLKGGTTELSIRAVDTNNNAGKTIKKITFHVAIPFYEKVWFWIIVSGLFFGGIFALYGRWRFLKQKEFYHHQSDLDNQRSKITADLHDDLGATLSSLQINSAIAQKLLEKDIPQTQKILQKIESQAKHISENIGDIIWSLKPGKNEFMSLSTRIINSANEILGHTEIPFEIKINPEIDTEITDFTMRKNLVLICKEALNNIAKYSQATEVSLNLNKSETHYILEISDNGTGFNPEEKKGNGLHNMKKRTHEMNGQFEICSDTGTCIKITIPTIRD